MTEKKGKRAVIINDIKSNMIEQAIFILRTEDTAARIDNGSGIVAEAQEIINNYIKRVERANPLKSRLKKRRRMQMVMGILVGILSVGALLTIILTAGV